MKALSLYGLSLKSLLNSNWIQVIKDDAWIKLDIVLGIDALNILSISTNKSLENSFFNS